MIKTDILSMLSLNRCLEEAFDIRYMDKMLDDKYAVTTFLD